MLRGPGMCSVYEDRVRTSSQMKFKITQPNGNTFQVFGLSGKEDMKASQRIL